MGTPTANSKLSYVQLKLTDELIRLALDEGKVIETFTCDEGVGDAVA